MVHIENGRTCSWLREDDRCCLIVILCRNVDLMFQKMVKSLVMFKKKTVSFKYWQL